MSPYRILVADDDEDHLFFIVRALRSVEGVEFEIDAVRDGEEAVDFVRQRGRFAGKPRPHLILLDLRMPRKDGFDVLADLKSDPELRTIPISVLTSSDRPEDVQEAYARGGNSYHRKATEPGQLQELLAGVTRYWTDTATLPEPPE
jgi:two-component system, chemotaxis family, response regulator Rcp1